MNGIDSDCPAPRMEEEMIVTIPAIPEHEGYEGNLVTLKISDKCPICGGLRGKPEKVRSYDGSRILICDGWINPCGHIDTYANVVKEVQACEVEK